MQHNIYVTSRVLCNPRPSLYLSYIKLEDLCIIHEKEGSCLGHLFMEKEIFF